VGRAQSLSVFPKPTIGILSTGDELIEAGMEGGREGGLIRDSNRPTLLALFSALVGRENVVDLGIVRYGREGGREGRREGGSVGRWGGRVGWIWRLSGKREGGREGGRGVRKRDAWPTLETGYSHTSSLHPSLPPSLPPFRDRAGQAALASSLTAALSLCDVLVTSGGVSMGEADLIKPVLASLGTIQFG